MAQKSQPASPSNEQLASPAIERKVDALLRQMTLEEKLGQLVQYNDSGAPSVTTASGAALADNPTAQYHLDALQLATTGRLGSMLNTVGAAHTALFQHAAVDKSRLHIPLLFGADVIHGYRTIYPIPLALAASFDPPMVTSLARMAAQEATTAGVRWFYSPMVDISRDARWGRSAEGAGEDPYLGAAMARAYVHGYQNDDLSKPDSVAACIKHFAAYGAAEAGREYNTTDMSQSRLFQVYLPPYKAAVEAGTATVMTAFNSLNGTPMTANPYLVNDVLRKQWHFSGAVVSDYTAIMELTNHAIASDPATAAARAITSGVDIDMMSHYYDAELPALVHSGRVPIAVVDEAVRRVLRLKFALGLFDNPYPSTPEVTAAVDEHRPLARQAAEESIVLLQNNPIAGQPLLPLAPKTRIVLIGPLADDPNDTVGGWGGAHRASDVITVKRALEERAQQNNVALVYAKGTAIDNGTKDGFDEAVSAASSADVVVMALGESGNMSGEAGSRAHLDLPGNQEQLLEAIAATGKPVVLLVFSGRPLVLTVAMRHAAAILEVWFPGTEGGHAIADLLFGDIVPSGKLPMSFPQTEGQEPLYYNQFPTGRPAGSADLNLPPAGPSRFISRYIDAPNAALFPFGFGLSYSSFSYSSVKVSRALLPLQEANPGAQQLVTVSAVVKNTGSRAATETVQCYVGNRGASLEQPVRSLQGFTRVTLQPGESREVRFPLGFNELAFYNNAGDAVIEPTQYKVWIGGSSSATEHADFRIIP